MGGNKKHWKKRTSSKSSVSDQTNEVHEKIIKKEIAFKDGSEGSGDEVYEDEYSLEDFVKIDFTDETDLFRHFFRCLKKTRHLLKLTEQLFLNNKRTVDELFEIYGSEPVNEVAFEPGEPTGGTNPNLLNASNKICLKVTEQDGKRRLLAAEKVNFGDVLIMERAIVMTDLLNTYNHRYNTYRCHHCLRHIGFFVTCPSCNLATFCGYNCRFISWYQYHRWECFGLQRRFWYTPYPQYIALRLMFYGAQSGFDYGTKEFQDDFKGDEQHYGDELNPYKSIYKLDVNTKERSRKDLSKILLTCSELLVYLIEDTEFFAWLCKFPAYSNKRLYDVYMIVGGILVRHYIQAKLHTIYVDPNNGHDGLLREKYDFESGGVFLTASLLKSHCKPNAVCSFRENYIIVRAFREIQAGEEITILKYRQFPSKETCHCPHCIGKIKKTYENNSLVCSKCQGKVLPSSILRNQVPLPSESFALDELEAELGTLKCVECGAVHDVETFKQIDRICQKLLNSYEKTQEVKYMERALEMYKSILQPSHIFFGSVYENIIRDYLFRGPDYFSRALSEIKCHLGILETHFGKYSYPTFSMMIKYTFRLIDFCRHFKTYPKHVVDYCDVSFIELEKIADFYFLRHKLEDYGEIIGNIKTFIKNRELEKKK